MMKYTLSTVLCVCLWAIPSFGQKLKCTYTERGINLQTKQYEILVAPAHFFNYTPASIKNDLQQDNLLEVNGYVSEILDETLLVVTIKVNSLLAQKLYGLIEPGNVAKVKLINEKEYTLTCITGSKGTLSEEEKAYVYQVAYQLTGRDIKQFTKKEIDKFGIQWSSGYEEYPIYEVDFLLNQIACLHQAQQARQN